MIPYRNWHSTKGTIEFLKPLFKQWHKVISRTTTRMCRSNYPDLPYWYGERTQVGWIALAAYEIGWLPLHEPPRSSKGGGRSDLWIYTGRAGKARVIDIEAKKAELSVSTVSRRKSVWDVDDIPGKLKRALKQALDKDEGYDGDDGIGLVFVILHASKNTSKSEVLRLATEFKRHATSRQALKAVGADFVALYFGKYSLVRKVAIKEDCPPYIGIAVIGKTAW